MRRLRKVGREFLTATVRTLLTLVKPQFEVPGEGDPVMKKRIAAASAVFAALTFAVGAGVPTSVDAAGHGGIVNAGRVFDCC